MAWDSVLEQLFAKRILQAHLAEGCVAGAYLLAGPEGVGKFQLAMEMAKALVCASPGARPCDDCLTCRQVSRRAHPDVHVIQPEGGASSPIKIEEIRHLLGRVALRPFSAAMQVAVIDGAERLTEEAANSLLKTLEEPSRSTRFLLTTVRPSHCLPTIVSRCQVIRCHPLSPEAIARLLAASAQTEPAVAQMVAQLSGGSASLAQELAKRWDGYRGDLDRFASHTAVAWSGQMPESRQDVGKLLDGLLAWLRDVTVAATAQAVGLAHAGYADSIERLAARVDVDRCVDAGLALVALRESLEQYANPKLVAALAREEWLALTAATHG